MVKEMLHAALPIERSYPRRNSKLCNDEERGIKKWAREQLKILLEEKTAVL